MKIAIRENELYISYATRFTDEVIQGEPYNYKIVNIANEIDAKKISYADFDILNGAYYFNESKYNNRISKLNTISYESLVEQYIREKYTLSQELAIHRQRDSKSAEWAEYNAYCEACKAKAKIKLQIAV